MAVSNEEQKLREETRTALLEAIKANAERVKGREQLIGSDLEHLANAYAIVTGTEKRPGAAFGG